MTPTPPALRFNGAEATAANKVWAASCGHHAIAAVLGLHINAIRGVTGGTAWMNPTNMGDALNALKANFRCVQNCRDAKEPAQGISRVQFEGPWTEGKMRHHKMEAYKHTHWIGRRGDFVFDTVLANDRWIPIGDWRPKIDHYSRSGQETGWHITHWYLIP